MIKEQYDAWHKEYDPIFTDPLSFQWYQTVYKLVPDLNSANVLEIGCGSGAFASVLSKRFPGMKLTAIDISSQAIEKAKENYSGIDFQVGDAENLQFDDSSFDFVISCETLEHLPHPKSMLKEIHRVLKNSGRFILTTENYFNGMILLWIKSWIQKKPFNSGSGLQPHENFFTFFMIRKWMRLQSFNLTHTESNHFQWLLLPGFRPDQLCTMDFKNPFLKNLFKPFGRHYTYCGEKLT
ncbi:MAG: hypothetical protein C5B59_15080 [Bacteroidetes bacterium]|nr:MAG: hypothetical protein C5B59_15080 [Bacteroidota bacterium]